jgi:hypothetical protein
MYEDLGYDPYERVGLPLPSSPLILQVPPPSSMIYTLEKEYGNTPETMAEGRPPTSHESMKQSIADTRLGPFILSEGCEVMSERDRRRSME